MIYLDNNATTRPSPGVAAAVAEALAEFWHNPSSVHRAGQAARNRVELARRDVAALLGVPAKEITFTSGGTEAAHLAIRGVLAALQRVGGGRAPPAVVSTRVEHAAVRELLEELHKTGAAEVRWAPIDTEGVVLLDRLGPLLDGAALASIQWAGNETGAIQPIEEVHALCRGRGVALHCDGTQWVGKGEVTESRRGEVTKPEGTVPLSSTPSLRHSVTSSLPCDLLSFAPHKFHGPKGVGVLWARGGVRLHPLVPGAQEMGRRGGTENVPGILGAGVACLEAAEWLRDGRERNRLAALRDRFERTVLEGVAGAIVNGPRRVGLGEAARRLWNTTNIAFRGLEVEPLLLLLSERGVCASAGAACSSGSLEPSPVLLAMGIPEDLARGSLRFSLSRETTENEIDAAAALVIEAAADLAGQA